MRTLVVSLKNYIKTNKNDILKSNTIMQIRYLISCPFIYGMFFPMVLFHLFIEVYHRVSFLLYGIDYVDYKSHFIFDRHKKKNLTTLQKFNCIYCEYGNGLASYVKEIIGKTEAYWCPIKHNKTPACPHTQYQNFINSKDENNFENKRDLVREKL